MGQFEIRKGQLVQKGYAITKMADGSVYRGQKYGKQQGYGCLLSTNGSYYRGEYKDGLKNGYGTQYDAATGIKIVGTFRNGHPSGPCIQYFKERKI